MEDRAQRDLRYKSKEDKAQRIHQMEIALGGEWMQKKAEKSEKREVK